MSLQLPQEIVAQIEQANADKESAESADSLDSNAGIELAVAAERKGQTADAALQAHRTASASGTTVINALLVWFNLQQPTGNTADNTAQPPQDVVAHPLSGATFGEKQQKKNRIRIP